MHLSLNRYEKLRIDLFIGSHRKHGEENNILLKVLLLENHISVKNLKFVRVVSDKIRE